MTESETSSTVTTTVAVDNGRFDPLLFWGGVVGLILLLLYGVLNSAPKIEKEVQSAVDRSLEIGGFSWAKATTYGQRVALSGAAPSNDSVEAAKRAIIGAIGSGGVFNGGVTKVMDSSVDVIAHAEPFAWGAIKENGRVALEGVVPDRSSREQIELAAKNMFGPENVTSRISLASGAPRDIDWTATAIAGLDAIMVLDRGAVEMSDTSFIVTGVTTHENVEESVRANISAMQSPLTAVANISGPAEWVARLSEGGLEYRGRVGSEEIKRALGERATDFFSATFDDQTQIGTTGSWGDYVLTALPHFARFRSGQISVTDKSMRISGEAPGSVVTFLKEDMAALPSGFDVFYNVNEIAPEITEIAGLDLSGETQSKEASCQTAFAQIMASNEILFASSQAVISRESGETLDKLVEVARSCSELRISVEGHTDATGGAAINRELSRARAEAVKAYFTARDVPSQRLTAAGYGEDRPVETNRTASGRAKNRRIEFNVSSGEGQ